MGVGVSSEEPVTAPRAILQIEDAKVADSPFRDDHGGEQKQFPILLRVLRGAGERNGETFTEYLTFPASGEISPRSKAGQVVTAALGSDVRAETLEALAAKLVGRRFGAQVGTSKNGRYSRVVHDTIGPAPPEAGQAKGGPKPDGGSGPGDAGSGGEEDFSDLPF